MDVLYRIGPASVAQVREAMEDPPGYSSVRTLLGLLEEKGHLEHDRDGTRYIYRPTTPPEVAGRSALSSLVRTFFGGSVQGAVNALLQDEDVDEDTLDELTRLVERAREERS